MRCLFCEKHLDDVRRLFVKDKNEPHIAICDECVLLAVEILRQEITDREIRVAAFAELYGTD